jgi:hypothetical protein
VPETDVDDFKKISTAKTVAFLCSNYCYTYFASSSSFMDRRESHVTAGPSGRFGTHILQKKS